MLYQKMSKSLLLMQKIYISYKLLLEASSLADKACLLSAPPHTTSSWLLVTPYPCLDPHQTLTQTRYKLPSNGVKGWTQLEAPCVLLCPGTALDHLGNHATRGDVATCATTICITCLSSSARKPPWSQANLSHTQPVDVLVLNWERWKHAVFNITVVSHLTLSILTA